METFIAAVLELGALMGALIAGVYADRYSRRYSIVLASSTFLYFFPKLSQGCHLTLTT